jgi:hypothetical protein
MSLYATLQIPVVEIDVALKILSIHAARQASVDSIKELLYILDEIVDVSPTSSSLSPS